MFSLEYFIGLIILGFILRAILGEGIAMLSIIVITVLWAFAFGFWAIATFFELAIGFAIADSLADLANKDD